MVRQINGLSVLQEKQAYKNSAKHALIGLTKRAALEAAPFGRDHQCACVRLVDTPLVRESAARNLAKTRNVSLDRVLETVNLSSLVPQPPYSLSMKISTIVCSSQSIAKWDVNGQAIVMMRGYYRPIKGQTQLWLLSLEILHQNGLNVLTLTAIILSARYRHVNVSHENGLNGTFSF